MNLPPEYEKDVFVREPFPIMDKVDEEIELSEEIEPEAD